MSGREVRLQTLGIVLVVVCVMLCAANPMAKPASWWACWLASFPVRCAWPRSISGNGCAIPASRKKQTTTCRTASPATFLFSLVWHYRIPVVCLARSPHPLRAVGVVAARLRSGFRTQCRGFARLGRAGNARPLGYRLVLFDCAGTAPQIIKFLLGVVSGVAVVHLLVELVWHLGLVIQPDPAQRRRVLAAEPTPVLLPIVNRNAARRRLIVCCDGTWNWPDGKRETNVIRLVRAIAPVDGAIAQMVYYHQGVGTGNILDRIVGGGAGVGLSLSVKACYGFITDNYVAGDEIFLFGFSRGAFIARSVAGLIGTVGVLCKPEMERFVEVWDWYSQPKEARNLADLAALAPRRHTDVEIECIGVWDTVGALGIPGTRFCTQAFAFYETELGTKVRHAFQALAIDERRANFQAAVWVPFSTERYAHRAAAQAVAPGQPAPAARQPAAQGVPQVLRQVWFPGAHSKYWRRLRAARPLRHHVLVDAGAAPRPWLAGPRSALSLKESRLLALDIACATGALDPAEPYPTGTLQNPLTIGWRLISCPVRGGSASSAPPNALCQRLGPRHQHHISGAAKRHLSAARPAAMAGGNASRQSLAP